MPVADSQPQPTAGEALQLAELAGMALTMGSLREFAEGAFPATGRLMRSSSGFLYATDPRLSAPKFVERAFHPRLRLAEEIAFAIRNARVFDYVVNIYCKKRQRLMSCRGCEKPLGSWTPCVKYREVNV